MDGIKEIGERPGIIAVTAVTNVPKSRERPEDESKGRQNGLGRKPLHINKEEVQTSNQLPEQEELGRNVDTKA